MSSTMHGILNSYDCSLLSFFQSASEKITAEATVTFDEDLYESLEVKYKEMVDFSKKLHKV